MGVLASKIRNAMSSSEFGLPDKRAYPMPDRSHAANAKGRATQQYQAGNLSAADKAKVDQKADAKLKKKGA
jgi:hypothetical protein